MNELAFKLVRSGYNNGNMKNIVSNLIEKLIVIIYD